MFPAIAAQLVLLCAVALLVPLRPLGAIVGMAYGVVLVGIVTCAFHRRGLGPADVVTLARALVVGAVTALVADGALDDGRSPSVIALVALTVLALVLDGVDGQVARRTNTCSAAGARFDMEVDAFLVFVLSVHVAFAVGPWVLVIGLMRYAFVAAGWALPWLQGSLPPSYFAKTVAAVQGVVLVVAASEILPGPVTTGLVGVALVLLCWSFGRSVWQLLPRTPRVAAPRTAPAATPVDA